MLIDSNKHFKRKKLKEEGRKEGRDRRRDEGKNRKEKKEEKERCWGRGEKKKKRGT